MRFNYITIPDNEDELIEFVEELKALVPDLEEVCIEGFDCDVDGVRVYSDDEPSYTPSRKKHYRW